jgi:hypothetical protein
VERLRLQVVASTEWRAFTPLRQLSDISLAKHASPEEDIESTFTVAIETLISQCKGV